MNEWAAVIHFYKENPFIHFRPGFLNHCNVADYFILTEENFGLREVSTKVCVLLVCEKIFTDLKDFFWKKNHFGLTHGYTDRYVPIYLARNACFFCKVRDWQMV